MDWVLKANAVFSNFEDLAVPTVTAINGMALGGGFEMCLASDYRIQLLQCDLIEFIDRLSLQVKIQLSNTIIQQ
jgi:esterase/lipase